MAEVAGVIISVAGIVITQAINAINKDAEINERKSRFTQELAKRLYGEGYNVFISDNCQVRGSTRYDTHNLEGTTFHIYTCPFGEKMICNHSGDGGYNHWCFNGKWWVRWGKTAVFHNNWNDNMGQCYETRSDGDCPNEYR